MVQKKNQKKTLTFRLSIHVMTKAVWLHVFVQRAADSFHSVISPQK